jgi:hypothetical protein
VAGGAAVAGNGELAVDVGEGSVGRVAGGVGPAVVGAVGSAVVC